MSYTALYRKWRPQRFTEVRGQDHIVKTLTNQLTHDRIGHAYLFCGTRGTGKTTVAKILARAVNCEHPVNGDPCNECPACRAILNGSSLNVAEIDAASNNGVDNIREIREEVKYKPTEGRYRVYIIDEVHMLSSGAFNALLKTLEEPPSYVIFILATTEVHKIPITILSRCQRYDFRRLSLQEIRTQLTDILEAEGISADEKAVTYLAYQADGSSRDGLSLLEQCISYLPDQRLSYERVLDVLGAVDQSVYVELLRTVLNRDVHAAVEATDRLLATGRDLSQFVNEFIWYLRNIMLIQTENPGEELLGVSRENLERMREEAEDMDLNEVMRYIRILSELYNRMRNSAAKRVLFELALVKMMRPETEDDHESILARLSELEARINGVKRQDIPSVSSKAETGPEAEAVPEVTVSAATYEDYQRIASDWQDIVLDLSPLSRSFFRDASVSADQADRISVLFTDKLSYDAVTAGKRENDLKNALEARYGKTFSLSIRLLGKGEPEPRIVSASRISGINMEIQEG